MDSVINAFIIYFAILIIFRFSGKRTLSQVTTFDFVLLLLIGEATQQALLGNDFSLTNSIMVIITLIALNVALSFLKKRYKNLDLLLEGSPVMLIKNGVAKKKNMQRERVDIGDIMSVARKSQGIDDISDVKHAILEKSGGITIIPKKK